VRFILDTHFLILDTRLFFSAHIFLFLMHLGLLLIHIGFLVIHLNLGLLLKHLWLLLPHYLFSDAHWAATRVACVCYSRRYVGASAVMRTEGADVVDETAAKLDELSQWGTIQPARDAVLTATADELVVRTVAAADGTTGGSVIVSMPLANVSFTHLADTGGRLGLITTDHSTRATVCHVLVLAPGELAKEEACAGAGLWAHLQALMGRTIAAHTSPRGAQRNSQLSSEFSKFARKPSQRLGFRSGGLAATHGPPPSASSGRGSAPSAAAPRGRMLSVRRLSREVKERRESRVTVTDVNEVIGITTCTYLGSVNATAQRGADVAAAAVADCAANVDDGATDVACMVSMQGLKVVEMMTSEKVTDMLLADVTFTAIVSDESVLKVGHLLPIFLREATSLPNGFYGVRLCT
jgi:hypothetical protein